MPRILPWSNAKAVPRFPKHQRLHTTRLRTHHHPLRVWHNLSLNALYLVTPKRPSLNSTMSESSKDIDRRTYFVPLLHSSLLQYEIITPSLPSSQNSPPPSPSRTPKFLPSTPRHRLHRYLHQISPPLLHLGEGGSKLPRYYLGHLSDWCTGLSEDCAVSVSQLWGEVSSAD